VGDSWRLLALPAHARITNGQGITTMNQDRGQENTDSSLARALRGDKEALAELLESRRPLMLRTARRYLRGHSVLKGIHDPEDAVEGAFTALWEQGGAGKLSAIKDVSDLCRALKKSLSQWINAASEHEGACKRGGPGIWRSARVDRSTATSACPHARVVKPGDLDLLESSTPRPDVAVMRQELVERLVDLLGPREREVVRLRLDGLTIVEIGTQLDLSDRTVNRILEKIRETWRSSGLVE